MQDEVREKSVAFVIRTGRAAAKLTEEMLKWAVRQYQKKDRGRRMPVGSRASKGL